MNTARPTRLKLVATPARTHRNGYGPHAGHCIYSFLIELLRRVQVVRSPRHQSSCMAYVRLLKDRNLMFT